MAVKVQYPNAERLMVGDLQNLRALAEFLQRTEFKFDLLSSIKELQKQIKNEFDFLLEAKNMNFMQKKLSSSCKEVVIPQAVFSTKRVLVMTFIEGDNLCKLAEFKDRNNTVPAFVKQKLGRGLLNVLAKAWGEMIFELQFFNADPHPGNVCVSRRGQVGLLDWGQVKRISDSTVYKFATMVEAMNSQNCTQIISAFNNLGIKVNDPSNLKFVEGMALTMLDTRRVPGFVIDPFSPESSVSNNTVVAMPSDLYFLVRTVQLMRGIAYAFELDYSLAAAWAPYARRAISRTGKSVRDLIPVPRTLKIVAVGCNANTSKVH